VFAVFDAVTPGGNSAPSVDAGAGATIRLPGSNTVALNGTVSDDGQPIATPITAWSVFSGPTGATFTDAAAIDTTVTFVSAGTYVLQLLADDTELQGSDTVTVIVEAVPLLTQIVVTPADVALLLGGTQLFSAAGADQYGDAITANISWTAGGGTIDLGGNYTAGAAPGPFTVTATDAAVSGSANVTITSSPPTASAGGPYAGVEGSSIALNGSGSSDADNDIVFYDWDLDNDGSYDNASGVNATFSAIGSGIFTIGLRVTDAEGASDTDTASVMVSNLAPIANAGGPYSGDQGNGISVSAAASSDLGNDIVSYEWDLDADGQYDDASGVSATFNSAAPGDFIVGLRVTDDDGASHTTSANVTVNDTPPSAPLGLSAVGGNGQVSLGWADNVEPDLAGYRVHRSQNPGGPYTEIAGLLTASGYIDTAAVNGTRYYYVVSAEDTAGNGSAQSGEASAKPSEIPSGPGLGNLSYSAAELLNPISVITSPRGHGNVAMVNGYLMVIYSSDSGGDSSNGGIEFYDMSDPRNPLLVAAHDNADTHGLREPHGFGFSNSYPGNYMVAQAVDGIQFWDVSDPLNINLLSYLDLAEISGGDYTGAWWTFWQAPYVYVAGVDAGLYVVDASQPTSPTIVKRLTTGMLGGITPHMAYAVGNLLIIAESQSGQFATLDISDPQNPRLIDTFTNSNGYSHHFAAGMLLTSGGNGAAPGLYITHVDAGGRFVAGGQVGSGLGNGGYGTYQDGIFHSGFSTQYAKFDVSSLTQIGTASSGLETRDEDFATVLGNVVFLGDDHGVGSAIIPHQTDPDPNGPDVHWIHPADGSTDQALTTRIGLSMSDLVDIESLDPSAFAVRPLGGSAVPGKYSVQMGLVNFSPDQPLDPNTTYEVVVNGVRDLVGNVGSAFTATFATGAEAPPNALPVCEIGESPAILGSSSDFVGINTGASPIDTYAWDFGDGSSAGPAAISSTSHDFLNVGRYGVLLTVSNSAGSGSCSAVHIVHRPLAGPSDPQQSSSIITTAALAINVNPDNDTATAIDIATLQKMWEAQVGAGPATLAEAANGDVWVVNQDDATISVLSSAAGQVAQTIQLPRASRPYGIVFDAVGSAFVSLEASAQIVKLDSNGTIVGTAAVGDRPRSLALAPDGQRLLVTQFVSTERFGRVWELNASDLSIVTELSQCGRC